MKYYIYTFSIRPWRYGANGRIENWGLENITHKTIGYDLQDAMERLLKSVSHCTVVNWSRESELIGVSNQDEVIVYEQTKARMIKLQEIES